jgi:PEP-CTERM motif-containing protein
MKTQTMQHSAQMDVQPNNPNQKENKIMKTQLRLASLSLFALICLTLAAVPASANLWDNGPINGTINAWTINYGYVVSDSFTLIAATNQITSFSFGAWVQSGDTVSSVDWSITSQPNQGTPIDSGTASGLQNQWQSTNAGYDILKVTATGFNFNLGQGVYYLNLTNATTPQGNAVYWDENDGVGCGGSDGNGLNCISTAYSAGIGAIPSESFTIQGSGSGGNAPEPSSLLMFGSGVMGLGGLLRRRFLG